MQLASLSLETLDPSVTKTTITKRGKEIPGDEAEREREILGKRGREKNKKESINSF